MLFSDKYKSMFPINDYNPILDTDSYKLSQPWQYPKNVTHLRYYLESRGGEYNFTLFSGIQRYIKKYLTTQIKQHHIEEAAFVAEFHGEPFYREGWEYIVNKHNGYLPLVVKSVPEGTIIDGKNVLLTIENTDPECFWVDIETSIIRIWNSITVGTRSYYIKRIIRKAMEMSCDTLDKLPFMLNDFGSRGVSSYETSVISGTAHLINFKGTDNLPAVREILRMYDCSEMPGYSIPAAQHSTITSWGMEQEEDAYKNILDHFAKKGKMVACVSDSYDLYEVVKNIWCGSLKQQIINSGAVLVVRPDSGIPEEVVLKTIQLIDEHFGGTTFNSKGYKLLHPSIRIIQGDGVNEHSIFRILQVLMNNGYSVDNICFGMGGKLLQSMDRDTLKFAIKCSAAFVDGKWVEVFKDPATDPGKASKRGLVTLLKDEQTGRLFSGTNKDLYDRNLSEALVIMYMNGLAYNFQAFDEIRERAEKSDISININF